MVSYKDLNTIREAVTSHTRDGVGNGDGGQTAAKPEAVTSQTRDGVGNGDGGQTAAMREAPFSQTRDGVGNGDGGQTAAQHEAVFSQTRNGVGNGDGGQTAAIIEARTSHTRDGICDAIIGHCFRNHYVTGVFIIIRVIIVSLKSDRSRFVVCIQIVEDSIYLCVMSPGRKGKT